MNFEELKKEAEKDLKIDLGNLQNSAADNCLLHNKYLKLLVAERIKLKGLLLDQYKIRKERYRFYVGYAEGEVHNEVLPERGLKIYMDADDKLIEHQKKIIVTEERIKFLEETLNSIVARGFNIKNIIEQRKIELGI